MRNAESRLASLPAINVKRSKFKMTPFNHLTTMNSGYLVPIFYKNVTPGGNYKMTMRSLVRMSTPIHPVMDDCYLDTYFFLVPYRLLWNNWEEFMGENKKSYWTKDQQNFVIPQITTNDTNKFEFGSVADHLGLPIGVPGLSVSALPFRGVARTWNEWFRDENTMDPIYLLLSGTNQLAALINNGYLTGASRGGALPPVSKFKDYFTSALPQPQRGEDVLLPLTQNMAPVVTTDSVFPYPNSDSTVPLKFGFLNTNESPGEQGGVIMNSDGTISFDYSTVPGEVTAPLKPLNLATDLSEVIMTSVNELRMAVALQTFYEAAARYGSRYTELLRGHFGIVSPDARLQRTEYIGGRRTKINMQQVLQTSSTNEISPQGNTAAFSLTAEVNECFDVSVVEHSIILGFACIRTKNTYQYGIERSWSYKDPTDFYFPEFAHIGEQPVYNKEIYAQGTEQDDEVFGYQEAWAEYRQDYSRITGMFRSNHPQSLDSWHYSEAYDSLPTLSESFIKQSPDVIDRSLAVSSDVADQFLCDFRFEMTAVLPMPLYSIPGFGTHF